MSFSSNSTHNPNRREDARDYSIRYHLLGTVPWESAHALQRRLAYECSGADDGRIVLLLCEHPPIITVGRAGSRLHIRRTTAELRAARIEIRWVGRGGGCLLHRPGQLAIYPIVPLSWHGWRVGDYLLRLQAAIARTLETLRIATTTRPGSLALWGRSGALAAFGVAVSAGVTLHGAFLNVNPAMSDYRFVDIVAPRGFGRRPSTTMGCLLAERGRAITMSKVRSLLVPELAAAFGTERYYMVTGHPLLRVPRPNLRMEQPRYGAS